MREMMKNHIMLEMSLAEVAGNKASLVDDMSMKMTSCVASFTVWPPPHVYQLSFIVYQCTHYLLPCPVLTGLPSCMHSHCGCSYLRFPCSGCFGPRMRVESLVRLTVPNY